MDLWAEFKVIDMGKRLGRFITDYRQEYFVPDAMNGQIVYSYRPKPGAEQAIYRKISDITISMKSTYHLKMPELISSEYKVYLSPDEQDAYDEMKKQFILDLPDGEISAANAAALSGKLSQMANGAIYDDAGNTVPIHEQKLDVLEDIIESANGKPLLVAYALVERYRAAQDRLDELQKLRITRSFQADVLECFMFEIKAIDTMLPLEFTDRFWNNQIDRVMVYHDGRMVFRFKNGAEVTETL